MPYILDEVYLNFEIGGSEIDQDAGCYMLDTGLMRYSVDIKEKIL